MNTDILEFEAVLDGHEGMEAPQRICALDHGGQKTGNPGTAVAQNRRDAAERKKESDR